MTSNLFGVSVSFNMEMSLGSKFLTKSRTTQMYVLDLGSILFAYALQKNTKNFIIYTAVSFKICRMAMEFNLDNGHVLSIFAYL